MVHLECTHREREVKRVGIHKGTKLTDNPKVNTLKFRYDDTVAKKLEYVSNKLNISKSEVVRKGIEIQYEKEKE